MTAQHLGRTNIEAHHHIPTKHNPHHTKPIPQQIITSQVVLHYQDLQPLVCANIWIFWSSFYIMACVHRYLKC